MTGSPAYADGGDESLRRAIAQTLADLQRRDTAAERFVLADPDDDDAVHVIEFGRADRPDHVETIDAGAVESTPSEDGSTPGVGKSTAGARCDERSGGDRGGS